MNCVIFSYIFNAQTVSEFAAVQVFQADEELNGSHGLSQRDGERDRFRDNFPGVSATSPSHSLADRYEITELGAAEQNVFVSLSAISCTSIGSNSI